MSTARAKAADRRDDPCLLPARAQARLLVERRLTAVELLDAHLDRIAGHAPALNAVVSLDADGARARAAAADAVLERGEATGPPIGIQIVGAPWSELRLLDIARELENADILPGFRSPPPVRGVTGGPGAAA